MMKASQMKMVITGEPIRMQDLITFQQICQEEKVINAHLKSVGTILKTKMEITLGTALLEEQVLRLMMEQTAGWMTYTTTRYQEPKNTHSLSLIIKQMAPKFKRLLQTTATTCLLALMDLK